jgi:hypothetical protein
LPVEGVEAVDFVFFAAYFEGGAAVEAVQRHDGLPEERCRGRLAPHGGLELILEPLSLVVLERNA